MKATVGSKTISTSDIHIRSFANKADFVKSQQESLKGILPEDDIKKVSEDFYDEAFKQKKSK